MLMIRPLPSAIMSSARSTLVIDSSRQIGVLQHALQLGVAHEIVVRERLLDHDQPERVELREAVGVGERVGGVRVRHERAVGPSASRTARTNSTSAPGSILSFTLW